MTQDTPAALSAISAVQARAIELNEKAFMPWPDAEALALSEAGIEDEEIDELIGNTSPTIITTLLSKDDVRTFVRAILVHQPATAPAQAATSAAGGATLERLDHFQFEHHGDTVFVRRDDVAAALSAQSPDSGAGPELHKLLLRELLTDVLSALEDGVDALSEVRSNFKEAYKGHRPEERARHEKNLLDAEAARAKLDAYVNGALAQQGAQNG